jgi:predicted TIM-barrel enzyme
MIVKKSTREEVMARLRAKIKAKKPLFFASCGTGLVAKLLEKAGADSITPFGGGKLRSDGWGSMYQYWPVFDNNGQLFEMVSKSIMPVLKGDAFVTANVNGNDPTRDMGVFLKQLKEIGVIGIINLPSLSAYDKDSEIYQVLVQSGINLDNEIEMLSLAREMGFITATMPFDIEDSIKTVKEAKPDIFCFHAGTTKGGLIGFDTPYTIEETAERTEEAFKEVLKIKPDLILFSHGASLVAPEDGQYILDNTSCHGVWTGSATERIPIENAVLDVAGKFANLKKN